MSEELYEQVMQLFVLLVLGEYQFHFLELGQFQENDLEEFVVDYVVCG